MDGQERVKRAEFPGLEKFLYNIYNNDKDVSRQFSDIFEGILNISELALEIFTAATVSFYEKRIIQPEKDYEKKVKPIQDSFKSKFTAPSLGTHIELARLCGHLIDSLAPIGLRSMRAALVEDRLEIGEISVLLKDMGTIFDKIEDEDNGEKPQTAHNAQTKWTLYQILSELKQFRNDSAHLTSIRNIIEDHSDRLNIDVITWQKALAHLVHRLSPFLGNIFRERKMGELILSEEKNTIWIINKDFKDGTFQENRTLLPLEDWLETESKSLSQIVLHDSNGIEVPLNIYPFILVNNNSLSFYKRTKAAGYQFFSISEKTIFLKQTKKKFSHTLFKTDGQISQQALFWSEVLPINNPNNTVKANIPMQGVAKFIGRKKQIAKIREEIIEIPNQNGFIHGVGGVGKTALAIELTKKLFYEEDEVLYPNIIWVSAKANFYNPILDTVEHKHQTTNSLKDILFTILKFFDYDGVEEYDLDELKDLVLDIFTENKVLLLIDNFETFPKPEMKNIIDFFQLSVKKHLRNLPANFKTIITSRELYPTGCHQISLEGLDIKDSRLLMKELSSQYKKSTLTEEQYALIHQVTFGIPIVIKHFFGQLYEFNKPFDFIVEELKHSENEVIKFSYSEIFSLLKRNESIAKIVIILELLSEPLSIRQMTDILEIDQNDVINGIHMLLKFQCLERINIVADEKYIINPQIGLLSKALLGDFPNLTVELRGKINHNLTVERKMDYTREEFEIMEIFKRDIEQGHYIGGEAFMRDEMRKHPNSVLLKYQWGKYLMEKAGQTAEAIAIMENLISDKANGQRRNPTIIHALARCYRTLDIPNFDKANIYYNELLAILDTDEIKFEIGEFYINWSSFLKRRSKELEPLKDFERRGIYKDRAEQGLRFIQESKSTPRDHFYYFLVSVSYHNRWVYDKALEAIDRAITLAKGDMLSVQKYQFHRNKVVNHGNLKI